ncbi:hypothetical protein LHYA1_G007406 [Lachnellula hyalina]|uniref:Uncharacterized protein n=1 Tax=Lachnellula hyalina TaxID=1316788 RepID=A0A8H8TYH9_9HELO|nr:uncharacterized protein LHYA1_G007406 [Lachnellula hyalina]TVY23936.1 hypothetical protein LHYA1_G007406 [Lachnellula hyalina]
MSTVLRPNAALIQKARAAGEDCKNLGIGGDKRPTAVSEGGNKMARVFGSDCTPHGLRFQFNDRIKPVTTRQLDMLAQGDDPKDIDLTDCKSAKASKAGKDIASLMGSDTSVSALKSEICERVKAIGKHQSHMKATGQDPAKIEISAFNDRKGRQDISTYFGTDSTGGGIGFQFRAIKADAKRQRDCIEAGGDPRDLNIGGKGE